VAYRVRTASTVIEMPRVAVAGRAQQDLIRTLPPRPVLPPRSAAPKAPPPAQPKPQLPAWLSRISQRFVE